MLTRIHLWDFTVFEELELSFSPGVNLFIGENGVGKTHLLKLLYATLSAHQKEASIPEKLQRVFLPQNNRLGRLVRRVKGSATAWAEIYFQQARLEFNFSNHAVDRFKTLNDDWPADVGDAVYVPVKEMLANAPGFRSLYNRREVHFEEIYYDLIDKAYLPVARGPHSGPRRALLSRLEQLLEGRVIVRGEEFFLKNSSGDLEFTLLAEGFRKFALLWILIQNETLIDGSTLFWDEPEANINPALSRVLVELFLELQRQGVQLFIATHSYALLKQFDLLAGPDNQLRYFSLYRSGEGQVVASSTDRYDTLTPNAIENENLRIYDEQVQKSLGESR